MTVTEHAGLEAIDAAWVTAVLRRSGATLGEVAEVRIEPMSALSAAGDLARLHLAYRGGGEDGPPTLIAKAPGTTEVKRAMDAVLRLSERERFVYAELAPDLPLRVPRCHHTGGDDRPLLLEDLGALRAGDQVGGLAAADADRLVERLADLHAAYWGAELDARVARHLLSLTDPAIGAMFTQLVTSGMPALFERYADGRVPRRILDALAEAAPRWAEVLARCAEGPPTLVHSDFRLDNIFFGPDDEPVVIDWQLAGRCRGTHDVAYLLSSSMAARDLHGRWEELLGRYHARLVERGVRGYSLEQCREHYRQSVLYTLAPGMALLGEMQIVGDERDLADLFIVRTLSHADDLDAFATL